jgi:hypothetical protein
LDEAVPDSDVLAEQDGAEFRPGGGSSSAWMIRSLSEMSSARKLIDAVALGPAHTSQASPGVAPSYWSSTATTPSS